METVSIVSRRYLGNKASLTPWIVERVLHHLGRRPASLVDLFAGTGSVAWAFNTSETAVLANDLLYSNYLCLQAWLGVKAWRRSRVEGWIRDLNALQPEAENYAAEQFGDRYWPRAVARHIGAARQAIEQMPATPDEKVVLVAALLYAADRIANTCGHYDAWRRAAATVPPGTRSRRLTLRLPDLSPERNANNRVTCEDANHLAASLSADVVYIDPPYNSRQYSDTYHVLENLARWEQPPLVGVARKMDRQAIKSRYCTLQAETAFADLVGRLDARLLVVSYNNMGERGDPRSNARISDEVLRTVLERRGRLTVEARDFRHFSAGQRTLDGHCERLFICRT